MPPPAKPATIAEIFYEMYNDRSAEFMGVIKRMIRLGYKIKIVPVEKDHQQSQMIGNTAPLGAFK